MNPGNALLGFLLLAGIFEAVGWQWAALVGGLFLAEALLKLLFKLLAGVAAGGVGSVITGNYNSQVAKQGPRAAALAEASHGAAMIVLPVVALLRFGAYLPSWSPLAAGAVMIFGGFRLFNGAKFSVGWRDPKLIARAAIKIVLAVLAFRVRDVDPLALGLLSLLGWWLLVTGITKLLLVLRGFPSPIYEDPGMPHGKAGFWNPDQ